MQFDSVISFVWSDLKTFVMSIVNALTNQNVDTKKTVWNWSVSLIFRLCIMAWEWFFFCSRSAWPREWLNPNLPIHELYFDSDIVYNWNVVSCAVLIRLRRETSKCLVGHEKKVRSLCVVVLQQAKSNYDPLGQIYTYFTELNVLDSLVPITPSLLVAKRKKGEHSRNFLRAAMLSICSRVHLIAITLDITIALYD